MKSICTYLDHKKWKAEAKYRAALLLVGLLWGAVGFLVWLLVRPWAFSAGHWMVCFVGCPMVASWIFALAYVCNHDFHDGAFPIATQQNG